MAKQRDVFLWKGGGITVHIFNLDPEVPDPTYLLCSQIFPGLIYIPSFGELIAAVHVCIIQRIQSNSAIPLGLGSTQAVTICLSYSSYIYTPVGTVGIVRTQGILTQRYLKLLHKRQSAATSIPARKAKPRRVGDSSRQSGHGRGHRYHTVHTNSLPRTEVILQQPSGRATKNIFHVPEIAGRYRQKS